MSSGIYQIRNIVNGKCYIGSAVDLRQRWAVHLSTLRHRSHYNIHLQRAFDKDSKEAFIFEVLEELEPENLVEREQYYLDTLNPEYNILPTAGSSFGVQYTDDARAKMSAAKIGGHLSAETCARMSIARMGERNPNYGKHLSAKTRAKISAAKTGEHLSAKTCARMSASRMGERNPNYGKHHSTRTRTKISRALTGERHPMYGKHHSEETKRKMSKARKAYWQKVREAKNQ